MAEHLQKFVEDAAVLPAELQRALAEIRELDDKASALQEGLHAAVRARVQKAVQKAKTTAAHRSKRNKSTPPAVLPVKMDEKMLADSRQIMVIAEQKVDLANSLYDFVDHHIRQLDEDTRMFDQELSRDRAKLGLGPGDSLGGRLSGARRQGKQKKRKREAPKEGVPALAALTPPSTGAFLPPYNANEPAGVPATSDEPTYCYCGRVSFGDMIACDNDDCQIEWFHVECVGLAPGTQPKGKWYCKECAQLKREGKIK